MGKKRIRPTKEGAAATLDAKNSNKKQKSVPSQAPEPESSAVPTAKPSAVPTASPPVGPPAVPIATPTAESIRRDNFKASLDAAFTRHGRAPLATIAAYAALPKATGAYGEELSWDDKMEKKADRYEDEGADREDAYASGGDTDDDEYYEDINLVNAYLASGLPKGYASVDDIAAVLL